MGRIHAVSAVFLEFDPEKTREEIIASM